MYLKDLRLKNFRSFSEAVVPLCPDLTIFVGENNGGKSNAIDAIRLLTMPLTGRREYRVFHHRQQERRDLEYSCSRSDVNS